jgi:asparagine synthase (glutamine-hydrolysing)
VAAIALLFARDGAPLDASRINRMGRRLAYRGSGLTAWSHGPIALAHVASRSYPGQICVSPDGRWHVVLDGRLDNRAALARELGMGPAVDAADDPRIAMLACARWREDAAARLTGDFAVAAWDAQEQQALLFRDVRGMRPLYFRLDDRELACASDLQALVRDRPAAVNEGMVAEWLTGSPSSHRETLYQGISRLPMACRATISRSTARQTQYWMPSVDPAIAAAGDAERSEAFVEKLQHAVRRRSDAGHVALMLSGGLDSSTLAAVLDQAHPRQWSAFTLIDDHSGNNERAYAASVAERFGAAHVVVEAAPVTAADFASETAASLDVPAPPNGLQSLRLRRRVVEDGYPVALSGLGSDEWFGGSYLVYADLAREGAYRKLAATVWADRHRDESTRVRLQIAAWALCPPVLKPWVRALVPGRSASCIAPAFARRVGVTDRLRHRDLESPAFPAASQQALYAECTSGAYLAAIEMQERGNAAAGLDERYPFHDRDLIDFSLSLPESDRWSGGNYKGIIRRAMAARLPQEILARQHSPDANRLVVNTLRALGGREFFLGLNSIEAGWIERARVLAMWDALERRTRAGQNASAAAWALWAIAAIELWTRHGIGGAGADEPAIGSASVA